MLKMHTLLSEETYKLIPALSPLGLPALIGKRMPYPFTFYIDNLTKLINNPEDIVESQVEKMLEASKAIVRICQDLCNGLISMNKKEAERNNIPENQIEVSLHFPDFTPTTFVVFPFASRSFFPLFVPLPPLNRK